MDMDTINASHYRLSEKQRKQQLAAWIFCTRSGALRNHSNDNNGCILNDNTVPHIVPTCNVDNSNNPAP